MKELAHQLYRDEHGNLETLLDSGFKYIELNTGQQLEAKKMPRHYLIMQISGLTSLTCNKFTNQILSEWQMVAVPKFASFEIEVIEEAKIVLFGFDAAVVSCNKTESTSKSDSYNDIYNFAPTEIKKSLKLFLNLIVHYLSSGLDYGHIQEFKNKELFLCLKTFYTRTEYTYLLHPIINKTSDFQNLILSNYKNFTCINEMITATNMSRSQFFVRFKKEFGITAKQWMLKHKTHEIQCAASRPDISAKALMIEFGFTSSAQFTQFCKLHFGCTPVRLIEVNASVKQ